MNTIVYSILSNYSHYAQDPMAMQTKGVFRTDLIKRTVFMREEGFQFALRCSFIRSLQKYRSNSNKLNTLTRL